jgi:VWFA-related protein
VSFRQHGATAIGRWSVCLLLLLVFAATFVAAATAGDVVIRRLDASDYPTLRVTVVTPTPSRRPPVLVENGEVVNQVDAENLGRNLGVVLALDHSQSMGTKPLSHAINAAKGFIDAKPASNEIAVVVFASEAVRLTGFSSSTIDADGALSGISMDRVYGTALYDAVVMGARALRARGLPGRAVILVTDGQETTSKSTLRAAIRAARRARAAVYTIAIPSKAFSPRPLKELARQTGGRYVLAPSASALESIYRGIGRELARTWRLEYPTAARPGDVLHIKVKSGRATGSATERLPGEPETSGGSGTSATVVFALVAVLAVVLTLVLWPWLNRIRRDRRLRSGGLR